MTWNRFCGLSSLIATMALSGCFDPSWPGNLCFLPGTMIDTVEGPISIESILPGQTVLAFDEQQQKVVPGVVEELLTKQADSYFHIRSESRELSVTGDHLVAVQGPTGVRWTSAHELSKQAQLIVLDSGNGFQNRAIDSIEEVPAESTVYNLRVRRYDNVFGSGILTRVYSHAPATSQAVDVYE